MMLWVYYKHTPILKPLSTENDIDPILLDGLVHSMKTLAQQLGQSSTTYPTLRSFSTAQYSMHILSSPGGLSIIVALPSDRGDSVNNRDNRDNDIKSGLNAVHVLIAEHISKSYLIDFKTSDLRNYPKTLIKIQEIYNSLL